MRILKILVKKLRILTSGNPKIFSYSVYFPRKFQSKKSSKMVIKRFKEIRKYITFLCIVTLYNFNNDKQEKRRLWGTNIIEYS